MSIKPNVRGDVQNDLNQMLFDSFGENSSPFKDATMIELMVYDEAYKIFGINGNTNTYESDFNRFMSYDEYLKHTGNIRRDNIDIEYLNFLLENYNGFLYQYAQLNYLICLANALRLFGKRLREMKRGGNKGLRTRKRRDKRRNKPYVRNRKYTVNKKRGRRRGRGRGRGTRKRSGGTRKLKHVVANHPLKNAINFIGIRKLTLLTFILGQGISNTIEYIKKNNAPPAIEGLEEGRDNDYDSFDATPHNAPFAVPENALPIVVGAAAVGILSAYYLSYNAESVCEPNLKDNECTMTEAQNLIKNNNKKRTADKFREVNADKEEALIEILKTFNSKILHQNFIGNKQMKIFKETLEELMFIKMKGDFDTRVEEYFLGLQTIQMHKQCSSMVMSKSTDSKALRESTFEQYKNLQVPDEQLAKMKAHAEEAVGEMFSAQITSWLTACEEKGKKANLHFESLVGDDTTKDTTAVGSYNTNKFKLRSTVDEGIVDMARGLIMIEWTTENRISSNKSLALITILKLYEGVHKKMYDKNSSPPETTGQQLGKVSGMVGELVILTVAASLIGHLLGDEEFKLDPNMAAMDKKTLASAAAFMKETDENWASECTRAATALTDCTNASSLWGKGSPYCALEKAAVWNNGYFPYVFPKILGWLWTSWIGKNLTTGGNFARVKYLVTKTSARGPWVFRNSNGLYGIASIWFASSKIFKTYNEFAESQQMLVTYIDRELYQYEFDFAKEFEEMKKDSDSNGGGGVVKKTMISTLDAMINSNKNLTVALSSVEQRIDRMTGMSVKLSELEISQERLALEQGSFDINKERLALEQKGLAIAEKSAERAPVARNSSSEEYELPDLNDSNDMNELKRRYDDLLNRPAEVIQDLGKAFPVTIKPFMKNTEKVPEKNTVKNTHKVPEKNTVPEKNKVPEEWKVPEKGRRGEDLSDDDDDAQRYISLESKEGKQTIKELKEWRRKRQRDWVSGMHVQI